MNLIPAIDLKDNKCVRLTKGKDDSSIIFNDNPVDQAIYFEKNGSNRLHIVDLDAAFDRKNINNKSIIDIRNAINIPIQIGGGIRNKKDAVRLFNQNINYLIIGSLAITDVKTVFSLADLYKDKIYVSLDVLEDNIMIKGWKKKTNKKTKEVFKYFNQSNIRGYVLTDVSRDGTMKGMDIDLINNNLKLTKKPVIVGGGLSSYNDLNNLKKIKANNLEGVIVGKSFYLGNIDLKKAKSLLKK